jgi:hypothetical protein
MFENFAKIARVAGTNFGYSFTFKTHCTFPLLAS